MSTYNKTNNDVKNLILIQKKNIFKSFLKQYIYLQIYFKHKSITNIVQIEENACFGRIDGSWKIFHW